MKLLDILNSGNWTRGAIARTSAGKRCDSADPNAAFFCLMGGLYRAYDENHQRVNEACERIETRLGVENVSTWNDDPERKWEDVEALAKELDL